MNDAPADLLTVDQALAVLDEAPVRPRVMRVKLQDAEGFRLAAPVVADRDYPPFDKSLMDGYAVRSVDLQAAPTELNVVGEIAAGQSASVSLQPGQAMAIMTGAPMPDGADSVVPVEDSDSAGPNRVRLLATAQAGRFIARRGSDCAAGSVLLEKGTKLEAAQLAVAASIGAAEVDVFARPCVAVLSTGDELVPIDQTPGPAQIRNSNNIMLVALLRRLGCDVTDLGSVNDDPKLIRQSIEKGLQSDILFVSGGMSMGQYDFVPKILIDLGVDLKITKLRIKPGKPFIFGVKGQGARGEGQVYSPLAPCPSPLAPAFVFGLPGNPVSSFVCTLRLCSRLIARMSGWANLDRWISAKLSAPLETNGPREFYQPAVFDGSIVQPLKWKGSADIYTLAMANALIVRPENAPARPAGAEVKILEIPS
ncbi:MAG TPA: gephyrin-like molybdotransferase Glp [Tepidisphaeraceae bacterium]|nr:gephyrin-like molybdotransferase Glp [Tepidisphaeraceae bacterium]